MARKTMKIVNPTQLEMSTANYRDIKSAVHRSDEEWKPIIAIPNLQDWYYVSNYGRVYSRFTGLLIKSNISGTGYFGVILSTKNGNPIRMLVHRLVMITFKPIPNSHDFQVNHIDGNKANNNINNLEWVTRQENILHAYRTGLKKPGESVNFAKINEFTVHEICRLLSLNYQPTEISRILNIQNHRSLINEIKARRNWKHISKDYDF